MAVTYKYEKPQVKVYQNFTEVNTATVGTQPVFVFGPAYQLYRYNNEDEHDLIKIINTDTGEDVPYVGQAITSIPYPDGITGVDTSWDRKSIYFEDVFVQVSSEVEAAVLNNSDVILPAGYTKEDYATYIGVRKDPAATVSPIRVGDYIADTVYQIERIYVNEQFDDTATSSEPKKYCQYIAKVDAVFDEDDLSTTISEVSVFQHFDSLNIPSGVASTNDNWEMDRDSFTIKQGVNVPIVRYAMEEAAQVHSAARIYVQFRYLDTSSSDAIDHIIDVSEITGQIDPGNPLWYGVYLAKINSGECPVYYMSTQGTELDRYLEVLKKATLTDDIYVLCPMTNDKEVLDAVEGHVNEMSGPETKRWRIAFIAPVVDRDVNVLSNKRLEIKNATEKNVLFVDQEGNPDTSVKARSTLAPDDIVEFTYTKTGSGTTAQDTSLINRIINNQLIQLKHLPDDINTSAPIAVNNIVHNYTSSELAENIAASSRHFADRRMYAVFPDHITQTVDGETLVVDGYFAAAAVAGLCSSTLPQQPLTNMPINGIHDVPDTYRTFDTLELNTMAAGGTFIVAQDLPLDVVYVRHQLSTATYQGNLLTRELSITKNIDSISYYLAEMCDDFIGKYNITPELIRMVRARLESAIFNLERSTNGLYGPQLLEENTEIISVAVHPTLADHVEAYIRLNPPKPFNVLEIRLTVV